MGGIFSRVRKKKSAVETLEKLENDIKQIEENRSYAQMQHRKITKMFLIYSFGLYILFGVCLYFQFTTSLKGKLLYLVPLALCPLLLYLIKRVISWYYVRQITKNQIKLNEMKKEKKRILDEVMDKETYKVAKEILEKYSTDSVSKPNLQLAPIKKPNEELRKRIVNIPNIQAPQTLPNMMRSRSIGETPRPFTPSLILNKSLQGPGSPLMRLPAPILPLERSYVDKIVEYLIGDGPNNRYALICSKCHSHNGMALKEEFEYISFKCCYCYFFNPARKIRPEAPKLENVLQKNREYDSDSESKTSAENSDTEPKAIMKSPENLDASNAEENSKSQEDVGFTEDISLNNNGENINGSLEKDNEEKTERRDSLKVGDDDPSIQPQTDLNCDHQS